MITTLKDNQIFVFGSNLAGKHGGGAASQAFEQFGAQWGVGEGITGQCYAFPTLNEHFQKLTVADLQQSVDKLYSTCAANPDKEFLLTKVGCGIAGFDESEIRQLFVDAPSNLILPVDWRFPGSPLS